MFFEFIIKLNDDYLLLCKTMKYSQTHKSKQIFWLLIKLTIVFICAYFIWQKLYFNKLLSLDDFKSVLIKSELFSFKNCSFLLILTFINWLLEILKWKTLVKELKNINLITAAKQSLASLTASLITPNRIGEYGAKALYFAKNKRIKILHLNLIGNLHQLIATVFFGVLGFVYFYKNHPININLSNFYSVFILICTSSILILVLWKLVISKLNFFKDRIVKIKLKTHLNVALYSFLRYLVFSHQFYFLLILLKTNISYIGAISGISTMYLISSFIPMLSIFDAVLKGSIALLIFEILGVNSIIILSITTLMWVLNFVLPSIIGSYFVITFNPKKLA